MAKLSDFLGSIASGISDARVNSDIQSLKIAEEYSKNDLLKHFSVPRMRIDKVELNIPVAVGNLSEKTEKTYEKVNKQIVTSKTYDQVLNAMSTVKIPENLSIKLKDILNKNITANVEKSFRSLETSLLTKQPEEAIKDFSEEITVKSAETIASFYKENRLNLTTRELNAFKKKVTADLQTQLAKEVGVPRDIKTLDDIDIIVESDKLREIKPENVIMIKMTLSEQGMEWVNMENQAGEMVSKLIPE